jgi:hypothetical protein
MNPDSAGREVVFTPKLNKSQDAETWVVGYLLSPLPKLARKSKPAQACTPHFLPTKKCWQGYG